MEIIRIEFPLKDSIKLDQKSAVKVMMMGLEKLIKTGAIKGDFDDILVDYEFEDHLGYCIATLKKDCLVDASKLNRIGASLVYKVDSKETLDLDFSDRQFSVATIQERLRVQGLNPKVKFRVTIQDYTKYWKSNKKKLTESPLIAKRLKNMFMVDLTGIFTEVLPFIQEGKQLNLLLGLDSTTDGLNNISRKLSMDYKKALKQSKTGQLSKNVFTSLQSSYSEFINQLVPQVFPGITEILKNLNEGGNKTFSEVSEGLVVCKSNVPKKIFKVLTEIKNRTGNDFTVKISSSDGEVDTIEFDPEDSISLLESKSTSISGYEVNSDGRIKLFN